MGRTSMDLKKYIRTVLDFPIEGIEFRDITSLVENPQSFNYALMQLTNNCMDFKADKIIGIESRGFVFGAPLARDLEVPFVMARKPGKLPGDCYTQSYELEYGEASLSIQCNTQIRDTDKVVIIDDLIATGGTAIACADILYNAFDVPKENILILAVIDLPNLKGSAIIHEQGYNVKTLVEFEGT
jgi:adenine phosphoribosyltransferase